MIPRPGRIPSGRTDELRATGDVAVIGAGIIGLATADALIEQGAAVTLYERSAPGAGQSGGSTRIFRHGHADRRLVALARESRVEWDRWAERFGGGLVAPSGVLFVGDEAPDRLSLLQRCGVPARRVEPEQQRAVLPLRSPGAAVGVLEDDAGAIDVQKAVRFLSTSVRGSIRPVEVLGVALTKRRNVEVLTGAGSSEYAHVVIAAGAGTVRVASGSQFRIPVSLSCHLRLTFAVAQPSSDALPCLQDRDPAHGATVYGSPLPGGDRYAIGLSGADGALAVSQDGINRPDRLRGLRERLRGYVGRAMPGLSKYECSERLCWVTELPWGSDGLAAWQHGPVTAIAGHNLFKFAPVLGQALARGVVEPSALERFRPERHLGSAG